MRILVDGIAFENFFQVGVQRFYRELLQRVGTSENISLTLGGRSQSRLPGHCQIIEGAQRQDLRESEFDVFQSTQFTASPWNKLPQVLQIHDMIPEKHWQFADPAVLAQVRAKREAGELASCITCLSQATADDVKAVYPQWSDKTRVIYPGVDHSVGDDRPMRVSRRPWREWWINYQAGRAASALVDRSYALFVGDRGEYKNFNIILDAMLEINWDDDVLLAVVGRPFGEQERLEIQKRNLQSRIKHVGRVTDARLRELYYGAVCFVFPSRAEGFGFPLIEAAMAGCSVVCSDIPIFHEIARDQAHYCPTDDSAAWAAAVLAASGRRMNVDEQEVARANASRFRWDRCAAEMLTAYRDAADA